MMTKFHVDRAAARFGVFAGFGLSPGVVDWDGVVDEGVVTWFAVVLQPVSASNPIVADAAKRPYFAILPPLNPTAFDVRLDQIGQASPFSFTRPVVTRRHQLADPPLEVMTEVGRPETVHGFHVTAAERSIRGRSEAHNMAVETADGADHSSAQDHGARL